jgi:hypothetical protein
MGDSSGGGFGARSKEHVGVESQRCAGRGLANMYNGHECSVRLGE